MTFFSGGLSCLDGRRSDGTRAGPVVDRDHLLAREEPEPIDEIILNKTASVSKESTDDVGNTHLSIDSMLHSNASTLELTLEFANLPLIESPLWMSTLIPSSSPAASRCSSASSSSTASSSVSSDDHVADGEERSISDVWRGSRVEIKDGADSGGSNTLEETSQNLSSLGKGNPVAGVQEFTTLTSDNDPRSVRGIMAK